MKMIEEGFTLVHPEKGPVRVRQEGNQSDDGYLEGNEISSYLCFWEDQPIWFCETAEQAEWVRRNSTPWYNADEQTPGHDFSEDEAEELVVSRFTRTTEITEAPAPMIPSDEEYLREAGYDEERIQEVMRAIRLQGGSVYSLYDLEQWLKNPR